MKHILYYFSHLFKHVGMAILTLDGRILFCAMCLTAAAIPIFLHAYPLHTTCGLLISASAILYSFNSKKLTHVYNKRIKVFFGVLLLLCFTIVILHVLLQRGILSSRVLLAAVERIDETASEF